MSEPIAFTDVGRSCVLVLPGGGYQMHAPYEAEPVAEWLNTLGLSTAIVRYPLLTAHPGPLDSVHAAIVQAKEKFDRVGVLGFSAGGHLAATSAVHYTQDTRPDAVVLCYAVITMDGGNAHKGSRATITGGDAAVAELLSLEKHINAQTPPSFVWHTADDASVPVQNALEWAGACAQAAVPCELHVFPTGRHGLGLAEDSPHVAAWTTLCAKWFQSMGWCK